MKPSHRINTVCALIICLNISACTTLQEKFSKSHVSNTQADAEELPPAALHQKHIALLNTIQSFQLKGRIGVQTEGKGYSASTQWQHSKSENQISILSPIGTEIANLSSREDAVTLRTQDGKTFQAKDAESLTQDTLGWRLPL